MSLTSDPFTWPNVEGQHPRDSARPAQGVNPFSRWAISWANWLITGLLAMVGAIVVAFGEGVLDPGPLLLIAIGGELAAGAVLFSATRMGARSARPALVVVWWSLAALAQSLVLIGGLTAFSPLFRANPVWGVTAVAALAVAVVIVQAATSAMLDIFDTCKMRRCEVEDSITKLRMTNEVARKRILAQQREIADTYVNSVIPRIDELVREVDRLDPTLPSHALGHLARECGVDAREHVRQLSHKLAQEPALDPVDLPSHERRARLGIVRALGATTTPVVGTTILAVCVRLPGEAIVGGSGTWVRILITISWVTGYFAAVKWARRLVPRRTAWGVTYIGASLALFYLLTIQVLTVSFTWFPTRELPMSPFVDPGFMTPEQAAAIWLFGAAVATTLIKAAEVSSNDARERRSGVEAQLAQTERSLTLELRRLRDESAHLLHGSVQGRLAMAGVMLRDCANDTEREAKQEKLAQIRGALTAARNDLLRSRIRTGFDATIDVRLTELAEKWRGLVDVTWTLKSAPEVIPLTPGEPVIAEVNDVVTEAVANASRHGQASAVDVAINVESSRVVVLVSDNGCGPGPDTDSLTPGLGTRLIQSFGGSYRLDTHAEGGAILEVQLSRS